MPKFLVTDTITYERTFAVWARSEDEAIALCDSGRVNPVQEEQIDNTPWEAEALRT